MNTIAATPAAGSDQTLPHRVYIAFGSNRESPVEQLIRARRTLALHPDLKEVAASRLYRTPPFGYTAQDDFINAVCAYDTSLTPRCLLAAVNAVEAAHGRVRALKNGPRTLDLDILLYDDDILHNARLTVPHPGIVERAFVLLPLADIAPTLAVPGQAPVCELLAGVSCEGISVITHPDWQEVNR